MKRVWARERGRFMRVRVIPRRTRVRECLREVSQKVQEREREPRRKSACLESSERESEREWAMRGGAWLCFQRKKCITWEEREAEVPRVSRETSIILFIIIHIKSSCSEPYLSKSAHYLMKEKEWERGPPPKELDARGMREWNTACRRAWNDLIDAPNHVMEMWAQIF